MLTPEFSKRNLEVLIRPSDIYHYGFAKIAAQRANYLRGIAKRVEEGNFDFDRFVKKQIRGFEAFRTRKLGDEVVLRRLSEVVRRKYQLRQGDRNAIVGQVKELLTESVAKHILRLDIKSFYESIDRQHLLSTLTEEQRLPHYCLALLDKFFRRLQLTLPNGLPRGLSISVALSEHYLSRFDAHVRRLPGVYYYARYVDDIIIFATSNPSDLQSQVNSLLPTGMELNLTKCHPYSVGCKCTDACIHAPSQCRCLHGCTCLATPLDLEYLGYVFKFDDVITKGDRKKQRNVALDISTQKIKRTKRRIMAALLSHIATYDYELLEKRISFLTGNQRLRRTESKGNLKTGIYYNYPLITNRESLKELDAFLRRALFSKKSSFNKKLIGRTTAAQRNNLAKHSFESGHKSKRLKRHTSSVVSAIRRCWKNA